MPCRGFLSLHLSHVPRCLSCGSRSVGLDFPCGFFFLCPIQASRYHRLVPVLSRLCNDPCPILMRQCSVPLGIRFSVVSFYPQRLVRPGMYGLDGKVVDIGCKWGRGIRFGVSSSFWYLHRFGNIRLHLEQANRYHQYAFCLDAGPYPSVLELTSVESRTSAPGLTKYRTLSSMTLNFAFPPITCFPGGPVRCPPPGTYD